MPSVMLSPNASTRATFNWRTGCTVTTSEPHDSAAHTVEYPLASAVFTSSVYGMPDFSSYSASKHALRAMTESLDIEWERHDIRVCDLMPPFVNTGMVQANKNASAIIGKLGVHLSADDLAGEVWKLVQSPKLHRPVSMQFRVLWLVTRLVPFRVTREILKRLWRR